MPLVKCSLFCKPNWHWYIQGIYHTYILQAQGHIQKCFQIGRRGGGSLTFLTFQGEGNQPYPSPLPESYHKFSGGGRGFPHIRPCIRPRNAAILRHVSLIDLEVIHLSPKLKTSWLVMKHSFGWRYLYTIVYFLRLKASINTITWD